MTHTFQLIEKVEFLLQLIAGTEAAESQTVVDICDLIGKVKAEQKTNDVMTAKILDKLLEVNLELTKLKYPPQVAEFKLRELKNPKNPE